MIKHIIHHSKHAIMMTLIMTLLLGVIVPALFTAVAQLLFPTASHGSLVEKNGQVIGSKLIGQDFTSPRYFKGRLSATEPPYNATASAASNISMANSRVLELANKRLAQFPTGGKIPISLVTSSGSGLDPHISPAAADFQAAHVARARGMKIEDVRKLIEEHTEEPSLGFIGPARVNVLELNMALDDLNGK